MGARIAINGYGRIGRCALRAIYERGFRESIEVVAINDIYDNPARAHLTAYDSVHGRFPFDVGLDGDMLVVGGDRIVLMSEPVIDRLSWGSLGVDLVLECTGLCASREEAEGHIRAGAARALLSYPGPADVDRTVVYGVNHRELMPGDRIVSNASCTSNCLVPLLSVIEGAWGVERGMVTTIHSYMNDQRLTDAPDRKGDRLGRSAGRSIVPVDTFLGEGAARLMPRLRDRITAVALRVPVPNVSALDMVLETSRSTSAEEVNRVLEEAAEGVMGDILGMERGPLVSRDFNHDPRSAIIDGSSTTVIGGNMVRLLAWFDNEWAYAARLLDTALQMVNHYCPEAQRGEKILPGLSPRPPFGGLGGDPGQPGEQKKIFARELV